MAGYALVRRVLASIIFGVIVGLAWEKSRCYCGAPLGEACGVEGAERFCARKLV